MHNYSVLQVYVHCPVNRLVYMYLDSIIYTYTLYCCEHVYVCTFVCMIMRTHVHVPCTKYTHNMYIYGNVLGSLRAWLCLILNKFLHTIRYSQEIWRFGGRPYTIHNHQMFKIQFFYTVCFGPPPIFPAIRQIHTYIYICTCTTILHEIYYTSIVDKCGEVAMVIKARPYHLFVRE